MITFVSRFVNNILESNNPRDFEQDFILLDSGLIAKKDVYMEVIYYLTNEDIAEAIITKINPGFILTFFRPENHKKHDSDVLIVYFQKNKYWLKPLIQDLSGVEFLFVFITFRAALFVTLLYSDCLEKYNNLS